MLTCAGYGCHIVERTMTSVGSDCALNPRTTVQGHSLEDGTFKSGPITIGAGCTVGTGAFMHYGVTMSDGAVPGTDSFVIKGEHIPPRAWWRGSPAAKVQTISPAVTTAPPPGLCRSPR